MPVKARPGSRIDRREQIIAAAGTVLAREGLGGASMKQIAAEIDVAPALLHYYFDSKEELLVAVVAGLAKRLQQQWLEAVNPHGDPLDRISAGVRRVAGTFPEDRHFWQLLLDLFVLGSRNQAVGDQLRLLFETMAGLLNAEIRHNSELLPSSMPIPVEDLAPALVGAVNGIAWVALLEPRYLRGMFRALEGMVLSVAAMAYVGAGMPPPLERLNALTSEAGKC